MIEQDGYETVADVRSGVIVTRKMLREKLFEWNDADAIADALGIPPEPPKQAPWEAAYEAWEAEPSDGFDDLKSAWQAAVEWAWGEAEKAAAGSLHNGVRLYQEIRRRIMGDA